jgi:PRC-barrel domain
MFTSLPAKDELSSKVVGLGVYNNANQTIGTIKDVACSGISVNSHVIGVDGFLGMGDHYVKTAPQYKYPGNS